MVDDKMLDLLEDDKIEASFFLIKKHADIKAIAWNTGTIVFEIRKTRDW